MFSHRLATVWACQPIRCAVSLALRGVGSQPAARSGRPRIAPPGPAGHWRSAGPGGGCWSRRVPRSQTGPGLPLPDRAHYQGRAGAVAGRSDRVSRSGSPWRATAAVVLAVPAVGPPGTRGRRPTHSTEDVLSLCSHQDPSWWRKLPAVRDTPRSAAGSTAPHAGPRPKVNNSPGWTRHVCDSYMTTSSMAAPSSVCHARFAGTARQSEPWRCGRRSRISCVGSNGSRTGGRLTARMSGWLRSGRRRRPRPG